MEGKLQAHIQVKQDNEFQPQLPFNTQIKPKTVWDMVWSRPGSATEGVLSASRGWLRLFLLLKLVTVLLFPHTAGLPLLVGCVFSLRALLMLGSPHISTKPSTVLLGRLALTDSLVLLHWMLLPGAPLVWLMEEAGCETKTGPIEEGESVWWNKAVSMLCLQLLDAHHLASLLLLGLLGLEATLVSRWPQQTRRFRTSHWAQLSCSLVWTLVLLELLYLLHSQLLQKSRPQTYFTTLQISQSSPLGLPSLPGFSSCLRRTLWLVNLWLHYAVFHSRSKKTKSFFH
ncbi:uncharacterized protein LOC117951889 [Etheostoma cragini]|uniref:uncharacterized protein LOC117951889 n=1 Tax=Etheostoma cragini TaxID=417921 RepID=UPI00155EA8D4|nr:uncharacterized protein LOC117951889 [Etheostoma cragini]